MIENLPYNSSLPAEIMTKANRLMNNEKKDSIVEESIISKLTIGIPYTNTSTSNRNSDNANHFFSTYEYILFLMQNALVLILIQYIHDS